MFPVMRASFFASQITPEICCILVWRERRVRHWVIKWMLYAWQRMQLWDEKRAGRLEGEDWLAIYLVSETLAFKKVATNYYPSDQTHWRSITKGLGI